MARQLLQRIDAVRRRALMLVWTRAVCLTLACSVAAVMLVLLLDWLIRSDAIGTRGLWLIGCLAAFVFAFARWILPALNYRPQRNDIARRIESVGDDWQSELTTAVELSARTKQNQLESSLIEKSWQRLRQTPVRSIVRVNSIIRPFALLMFVAALGGLLFASQRSNVTHSLKRIAMPWSDADWPRQNRLEFVSLPDQVARGSKIQIEVRDGQSNTPNRVTVEVSTGSQAAGLKTIELQRIGDLQVFAGQVRDAQHDLQLRATGGDDRTDWHSVRVVDFPGLVSSAIHWSHPQMTGGRPQRLDESTRLWSDSGLTVQGTADSDLSAAWFVIEFGDQIQRHQISIANDGRTISGGAFLLTAELTDDANRIGSCWFELTSFDNVGPIEVASVPLNIVLDQPPIALLSSAERECGVNSLIEVGIEVQDELPELISTPDLPIEESPRVRIYQEQIDNASLLAEIPIELHRTEQTDASTENFTYQAKLTVDAQQLSGVATSNRLIITAALSDLAGNQADVSPISIQVLTDDQLRNQVEKKTQQLTSLLTELQTQQSVLNSHTLQYVESDDGHGNLLQVQQIITRQAAINKLIDDGPRSSAGLSRSILDFTERHRLNWNGLAVLQKVRAIQDDLLRQVLGSTNLQVSQILRTMELLPVDDNRKLDLSDLHAMQKQQLLGLDEVVALMGTANNLDEITRLAVQLRDQQAGLIDETASVQKRQIANPRFSVSDESSQLFSRQSRLRAMTERLQRQLAEVSGAENGQGSTTDSIRQRFVEARDLATSLQLLPNMLDAESSVAKQRWGDSLTYQNRALEALVQIGQLLAPGSGTSQAETADGLQDRLANTLAKQIDELTQKLQDFDSRLNQHANASKDIDEATRKKLDGEKAKLQQQLVDLKQAMKASQFSGLQNLIERAIKSVAGSTSELDPENLANESDKIQSAIRQLQNAALQLANANQTPPEENTDLARVLEFLLQLQQAQLSINHWSTENSPDPSESEIESTIEFQEQVRTGFETVESSLSQFPTAAILTNSISNLLNDLLASLSEARVDDQLLRIQSRVFDEMQLLIRAIEIQLESNRDSSEMDTEDPDSENEQQPDAAGISSFELTMLYVLQTGIQRDTEALALEIREAGRETEDLHRKRMELGQRQTDVFNVLNKLLEQPGDSIPSLPDF